MKKRTRVYIITFISLLCLYLLFLIIAFFYNYDIADATLETKILTSLMLLMLITGVFSIFYNYKSLDNKKNNNIIDNNLIDTPLPLNNDNRFTKVLKLFNLFFALTIFLSGFYIFL